MEKSENGFLRCDFIVDACILHTDQSVARRLYERIICVHGRRELNNFVCRALQLADTL